MNDPLTLTITPRDPLIARDGRPFVAGLRMKSLDWFYPPVVAGSLRTLLGNLSGGFHSKEDPMYVSQTDELKAIGFGGPFPCENGQLYFPFPLDVEVSRDPNVGFQSYAARPVELSKEFGAGSGCDLPGGLEPALLPELDDQFKPQKKPAFLSADLMTAWLLDAKGQHLSVNGLEHWPTGFLQAPAKDRRMHVKMNFASGAGVKDAGLFQTVAMDLYELPRDDAHAKNGASPPSTTLSIRLDHPGGHASRLKELDSLSPLGGERRIAHWQITTTTPKDWTSPKPLTDAFKQLASQPRKIVRMVLATPAIFREGWKPAWLTTTALNGRTLLCGQIPNTEITVRLISACVGRWQPISGWGYEPSRSGAKADHGRVGAKAVRRMVPAGSVYFLEVIDGDVRTLAGRWLQSVSDDLQDRLDGFGLALWGLWSPQDDTHTFEVK